MDDPRPAHAETGADVSDHGGADAIARYGDTALHYACGRGDVSLVLYLLNVGCDPNAQNSLGNTPLTQAALKRDVTLTRLLLSRGADADHRDMAGFSPILFAGIYGNEEVFDVLLGHGADPYVVSCWGNSLHTDRACGRFVIDHLTCLV